MYHFIVNPCSRTGKAKDIWNEIERELQKRNVEYQVYLTEHSAHATQLAETICKQEGQEKHIVIVGGDGTVNETINGLSDYAHLTLGYIPVGSGNDFARGLGLPNDPLMALNQILSSSHTKQIDHGLLTYYDGTPARRFGISSGIGYDADVCYEVQSSALKRFLNHLHLGKLSYYIIAVKQIFTLRPLPAQLIIDDQKPITYQRLLFVASMIQKYEGGGLMMAPTANHSDRKLTLCIVHDVPKLKLFLVIPSVIFGKHAGIKGVELLDCDSVEIMTDKPMSLHTDGELAGKKNHIRVSCYKDQATMVL